MAIILERDLDNPAVSIHDLIAVPAYVLPTIEIIDSRIADWKIRFADTVADNGFLAFFVLGITSRLLDGVDLRTCGIALDANGAPVSMGAAVACFGHPLTAALSGAGEGLRSGDIVGAGALESVAALTPGDIVRADVGGLGNCGFAYRDDRAWPRYRSSRPAISAPTS